MEINVIRIPGIPRKVKFSVLGLTVRPEPVEGWTVNPLMVRQGSPEVSKGSPRTVNPKTENLTVQSINQSRTPVSSSLFLHQLVAYGQQFLLAVGIGFGVAHFERLKRIEDNLGNNQAAIFFVIGRDYVPRRGFGAGFA